MRAPAVVATSLLVVALGGCATAGGPRAQALLPDEPARFVDGAPARLPAPETTIEAQAYLSGAIAALRGSQPRHASAFIDAILRSDHLTDRGRANVYWLGAEAHRQAGDDGGLVDALGGFLVAAAVLPPDDDMQAREVEARAVLVALRLQRDPHLGTSPDEPIVVEDVRDAPGIVAELGCVERAKASHGVGLEERRVLCGSAPRVLWFDLSHSQ